MDPVVHFEMPFEDQARAAEFYKNAFGWKAEMMGPEYGQYVVVTTTDLDPTTKFPKAPGQINGGLFPKTEKNKYPSVVIAVKDVHEAIKKIEAAGGKLMDPEPRDIPGVGLYIGFIDTEGNRVSALQPKGM